jgi:hypothetical protein
MANELASHGYIDRVAGHAWSLCVGGEFYPFRNESADGFRHRLNGRQSWTSLTGKVGCSAARMSEQHRMLAAMAAPPHLFQSSPTVTASEYYDGWTYQNGA